MIRVRRANLDDLKYLVEFQCNLALESENVILDRPVLEKGIRAMFEDPAKGYYNVAMNDSEVIGCHMITYEWSDWRNGMVLWIQSVYVKESHRKRGVFKTMYDSLTTMIKSDPGLRGLRLYVDKTNERAMKTYAAMGMDGAHYTVYEWMKS